MPPLSVMWSNNKSNITVHFLGNDHRVIQINMRQTFVAVLMTFGYWSHKLTGNGRS